MPVEQQLRDTYLELNGLQPGLITEVDPRDEMYRYLAALARRPDSALLDYVRSGHDAYLVLEHLLAQVGTRVGDLGRALDLAAGYGRLLRFLCRALDPQRIWAAEIDPGAVEFATRVFGVHGLRSHADVDRLDLPGPFDLIWVGSLFTHLPRGRFEAWLGRLFEALSPDGTLMFTTHGEGVAPDIPLDPSGFTFVERSETERLALHEYGTTWVAPAAVEEIARACGIAELGRIERGLWERHDVWVARRRPTPALRRLTSPAVVDGRIQEIRFPSRDHIWVSGWSQVVARAAPIEDVCLYVDGRPAVHAQLGEPRELEPAGTHREARVAVEWYSEGAPHGLGAGASLAAVGTAVSGRRCFDCAVPRAGRR